MSLLQHTFLHITSAHPYQHYHLLISFSDITNIFYHPTFTMAEVVKLGTTISLTTLEKIRKLQDQEGYLKWKRTMRDHLKIFGL